MSSANCESTPATMDWSLCFICQSDETHNPTSDPSSSVKLKNNPERLSAAYRLVVNNIQELNELGELPDFVFVENTGDSDTQNIVQLMMSNHVVWHKACRNAVDNQKVQRARNKHQGQASFSPVKTRAGRSVTQTSPSTSLSEPVDTPCLFCDEVGNKKELRKAATLGLDKKVNDCAQVLGDKRLLSKLSAGDLIAINAVYHRACLTRLYRKVETVGCDITDSHNTQVMRAHVLNELLDFIEDNRGSGESLAMAHLTTLYDKRIAALGFPYIKCNTTRLREDIERMIPDIKAVKINRCWSLVFDDDLSKAIVDMKDNTSTEVSTLHKAAKILRREYLKMRQAFTGSFSTSSEAESIPTTLRSFLYMLLDGPSIDQPSPGSKKSKVATSIGQQIIFNSVARRSKKHDSVPRHNRDRETPASLYMAMKVHLQTGRESLIDDLHQRGLCISYDRLRVLSTDIANSVIGHWEKVGVVVPPQAVKHVFTTGGFDNIDHNPSSTTATSALHGTCISIHQHFSSDTQQVANLDEILNPDEMGKKTVRSLPTSYTGMDMNISLPNDEVLHVPVLMTNSHPIPAARSHTSIIEESYVWLERVRTLSQQVIEPGEWISWAAYHASITEPPATPPTKSYMLPIFIESSNSPIMVWHGMTVLHRAISYLNPGQTPVMVADQPLFTLAKKLQWKFPQTDHGEDSFLVTLGAMHTEKMLWSVSGDWLNGSGWTTALTNSGISTSGKAESFIGVHHICRTRYMHQVSVAALYMLMKTAYEQYVNTATTGDDGLSGDGDSNDLIPLPFEEWLKQLCKLQPQADYWFKSMELDLLVLQFVKSCRTADFSLYMETLDSLMPWIFALDHTHYARNLPIHLRDMATLEERHPALYVEFKCHGHFMGQKTRRAFSRIPRDQMHEQLIDWLKNLAGVIENLDDPRTVRREQVVRPEMARLIREMDGTKESDERMHHEQYTKFQIDYKSDVLALVDAFEQLGNPFMEDSGELLDLDQSIFMPPDVVDNVRKVKNIGLERYKAFVDKRIYSQEEAFTATIPHTKLKLFESSLSQPRQKSEVAIVKDQQAKVTQILLAAHSGRNINESVFSHESSAHPPSLTRKGYMHHGNKSEILDCIVPANLDNRRPETTAAVLDGAVLVQMLRPRNAVTIGDYFKDVFLPYILSWFEMNNRVDIVWDVYSKTSLKSGTREQRGSGARRRVTLSTKVPGNWAAFLRVDLNKQELFMELAKCLKLATLPQGKQLFTTILSDCESSPAGGDVGAVAPCTHEEADTRVFLHVAAATSAGHRRVIVRTSDSDVVVLGVSSFVALGQRIDELWIAFGMKRHFRYIPVHDIVHKLGPSRAKALPAFHAITGCDTTSAFFGKGKKTAWAVWQSIPELTLPLELLSCPNPTLETINTHTSVLQRFILLLYGVTKENITTVDAARHSLFLHQGRDFEHMPPSSDALHQHLLRVAYQSGHVWGNTLVKAPAPVSPTEWGWQQESPDSAPTPVYTTTPTISRDLPELAICKCKTECKAPCKCCVQRQRCMLLCRCQGSCAHTGRMYQDKRGEEESA